MKWIPDQVRNDLTLTQKPKDMTKYILHGGATRRFELEGNRGFFKEILADLPQKVKVLLIYFAREEKEIPENFMDDKNNFQSTSPNRQIEFQVAQENPLEFKEQIKWADAIYVRGGNTQKLLAKINQSPDFADLIKGKVYAGSSAGMYLVCKHYYSNDRRQFEQGLGILPIKGLAHWDESKQDILEKLRNIGEDLPIYKVAEGQFIVLNVD